ncbi:MAG: hypothetical protein ABSG59_22950 [Verrucomicrobiota bacterium]|jgi:hypothetical protein
MKHRTKRILAWAGVIPLASLIVYVVGDNLIKRIPAMDSTDWFTCGISSIICLAAWAGCLWLSFEGHKKD